MKKILCHALLLLAAITSLQALDSPYFTGYAGFLGNFTVAPNDYRKPDKEGDTFAEQIGKTFADPQLFAQGYFGGQLQFKDLLMLHGDFCVDTKDILGKKMQDTTGQWNSTFRIQETSAVLKLRTSSVSHYIAAFYGEYEPIGSDVFLQRQFGIDPIRSDLTSSFTSLNGTSINSNYGGGLSYVLRLPMPIAAGLYLYKDQRDNYDSVYESWENPSTYYSWRDNNLDIKKETKKNTSRRDAYNADLRVAGAFENITFDFRAGAAITSDSRDGSLDSGFMKMDYLSIKAGMNILAGKPTSTFNVLLQTGFSDLIVDPGHVKTPRTKKTAKGELVENNSVLNWNNAAHNFYFLLEPRINLKQAKFSATLFNIPYSQAEKMFYLNNYNGGSQHRNEQYINTNIKNYVNPCGIDLHASTDMFRLGDMNFTTGMHLTFSMGGQTLQDLYRDTNAETPKDNNNKHYWNKTVFATPYVKIPVHGGEIFAATTVSSQIFNKQDNWPSAINVKIGFKINF